ncbi:MAG TPA: hypothetical protein VGK49_03220 [Ilumatobacteraceae bacterium]
MGERETNWSGAALARLVGQSLTVRDVAGVDLVVTGVVGPTRSAAFESTVVRLDGPRTPALPQGMYTVVQIGERLGPLFLVPVGQTGESTMYEVVFNELVEGAPA